MPVRLDPHLVLEAASFPRTIRLGGVSEADHPGMAVAAPQEVLELEEQVHRAAWVEQEEEVTFTSVIGGTHPTMAGLLGQKTSSAP